MQGHGRLYLYNYSLFSSHSIPSSSLLLTSMAFSVTGETHNAFLKLSDAKLIMPSWSYPMPSPTFSIVANATLVMRPLLVLSRWLSTV